MLHFPVVKRAVQYVEQSRDPDHPLKYTITTNGTRLGPDEVSWLDGYKFRVNLSFDGVPAAQALRGKSTFRQLDQLLDCLRNDCWTLFDRRLLLAITLTPSTIPYLADSVDYFISKGVRTMTVSPAMRLTGWRAEQIELLDREFSRIFQSVRRIYEDSGQVPLAQFRKTSDEPKPRPVGESWLCNAALGQSIAVDVDGIAYGCLLATSSYHNPRDHLLRPAFDALRIGDPIDPKFHEKLASMTEAARACGLLQHAERRYSSYRRCADCTLLGRCHVCPFSAARDAASCDVYRVDDFSCAFNQVVFNYADRFPCQPDTFEILSGQAKMPRLIRELMDNATHATGNEGTATAGDRQK